MAVGLRISFNQLTLDDYDKISQALNMPSDWPNGLRSHSSHESDGRLVANDVWDSRQQFDDFVQARLGPAMGQALGDRAEQPNVTETALHTFYNG